MKKSIILFSILFAFSVSVNAQERPLDEYTVVTDSLHIHQPYASWKAKIATGDYILSPVTPGAYNTEYLLIKLKAKEKETNMSSMDKPTPSTFFTNGKTILPFTARDIYGFRLNLKTLIGKVVVIHFWSIECITCPLEFPELNKISTRYSGDPNVEFISVCLQHKYDIQDFIKNKPFLFHIVDDGQAIFNLYKIDTFPTEVVLDRDGKVVFQTTNYHLNTAYWIQKSVEEALAVKPPADVKITPLQKF